MALEGIGDARNDACNDWLKIAMVDRSNRLFDIVERQLAAPGPWLLGERYSALDIYLFTITLWARPSEAALHGRYPRISAAARDVRARPQLKAALEAHGVLEL